VFVEIHQTLVSEVELVCDPMVCGLGFHQILVSEVDRGLRLGLGIHQSLVSEVDPLFLVDIVWDRSEIYF
jgi:hypothetical protein